MNKLIYLILLILCLMKTEVNIGQHKLSMKQALDSALANHPLIKASKINIQQADLARKGSISPQKTDITYQYGQINFEGQDYWLQVDQHFGNPLFQLKENKGQEMIYEKSKLDLIYLKRKIH